MKNIVLLTGITGYLGSYIASELVNRGDVVIGLKRSASDLTRIKRIINKLILYFMLFIFSPKFFFLKPIQLKYFAPKI